MDVKKIGRIPDGGGWRVHGRGKGDNRDRKHGVGYDYVHSIVDDHSRLAYSEILADEKGATCAAFLDRAIAYFADHGINRIERLMTDNAWAYRWSLREVCAAHGITQKFIKPHCPWQNGKVERLNRTLATEWAYRQVFTSNAARAAALAPWLEPRKGVAASGGVTGLRRVWWSSHRRGGGAGGLQPVADPAQTQQPPDEGGGTDDHDRASLRLVDPTEVLKCPESGAVTERELTQVDQDRGDVRSRGVRVLGHVLDGADVELATQVEEQARGLGNERDVQEAGLL